MGLLGEIFQEPQFISSWILEDCGLEFGCLIFHLCILTCMFFLFFFIWGEASSHSLSLLLFIICVFLILLMLLVCHFSMPYVLTFYLLQNTITVFLYVYHYFLILQSVIMLVIFFCGPHLHQLLATLLFYFCCYC